MKDKICGVYKITNNLNGKSYIGQSVNCMSRWCVHKSPSVNYAPIDKAINEFGKENFTFSILLECPADMLDVWERDMINLFDTMWPKGYNMCGGGKMGFNLYDETRNKGEKNPFYKHTHTDEARRKMSQSKKGHKSWNKDKVMEKIKYLTPNGEIKYMDKSNAGRWHPNWILIEKDL